MPDTCAYCGHDTTTDQSQPVPAATDHESWAALAVEHFAACEWFATRAHRVFGDDGGPHVGLGTADHIDSKTHNRATGAKY